MSATITVRAARTEDAPAIHEITLDAFAKYQRDLGLPGRVAALQETVPDIEQDIARKIVLVAERDGELMGSLRLEVIGNIAYLSRFGVSQRERKGGVGGELMAAADIACRERGLAAIALHTSTRMTDLVRFYYKHGYFIHSTSTHKGYIRGLFLRELASEKYAVDGVAHK